ncbi:MAG: tRNA (guanine(26)-N(2))-dimethyltransferase [Thermoplasmata archaeon]
MNLVNVREGNTELLVPEHKEGPGPKSARVEVFYNPAMEFNRDVSISFLNSLDKEPKVLDAMAATGARGVRIANEVDAEEVVLLDVSESAVDLIKNNIRLNDVSAEVVNSSLEVHIPKHRYRYDYIDIDPFGSPVHHYPTAVKFVSRGGIVAVSATDTAVLCGTYPKKCIRRYSSKPKNNWCRHENGLRILIAYCVREAARYHRAATPVLSYYDGHHFRTYLKVDEGAKKADVCLDQLENYEFEKYYWKPGDKVGPLWSGELFDRKTLGKLEPVGKLDEDTLDIWKSESGMPVFFYDGNILGKYFERAPIPIKDILENLRDDGYRVSRTHFSPTGFKTNAPKDELRGLF